MSCLRRNLLVPLSDPNPSVWEFDRATVCVGCGDSFHTALNPTAVTGGTQSSTGTVR